MTTQPDVAWQRVHWSTPWVRSWSGIVVGAFLIVQNVGQDVVQSWFLGEPELPGSQGPDVEAWVLLLVAAAVLVVACGVTALAYVSWRATRYRITSEAVELHRGVIFRSQKAARLDRIQAVDVVKPFVPRVLGLAQVTIEVAGGGDSKVALQYLRAADAQEVRAQVLARAAGLDVHPDAPAPQAIEQPVVTVPAGRLIASIVLSSGVAVVGVVSVVLVIVSVALGTPGPLAVLVPAVLGAGGAGWGRFSRGFGFRVGISADGLRLRHGLLDLTTQTLPPGRVQAVRLSQPLLWRARDWWQLEVNVAGYGFAAREEDRETLLLPVGTQEEAFRLVALLLGDLGEPPGTQVGLMVSAMCGENSGEGFVTSPRAARRVDPLAYRRNGYRVAGAALVVRRGRLRRVVDLVPHARTQSLGVMQGPLQRRLGLASVTLHSTPGPISPVVPHLSVADAAFLLDAQAERARTARAGSGSERWLERPAASPPPVTPAPPQAPAR